MFRRKYNLLLQPLVWAKYRSMINIENIESLSAKKINKIFRQEDKRAREWYLHYVTSQWFDKQQDEWTWKTLDRVNKIIKKCKLILNEIEKHDLLIIEERIFSSERTLKTLDTTHKLQIGEQVNAIFQKCNLFEFQQKQINFRLTKYKQFWTQKKYLKLIHTGVLFISNKKFIIETKDSVQNLYFKNIISYVNTEEGFEFEMYKKRFLLKIHDQQTLNQIIDLIFRKRAKSVIEKRKNN